MIGSIAPKYGYGNSLPMLVTNDSLTTACLAANLNAVCLDFVARQKIQGTNLNLYMVEQLPVIAPEDYDRQFGNTTARALGRVHTNAVHRG